ncbi:hypothetical protein ES702_00325 [subsurface metagenome]
MTGIKEILNLIAVILLVFGIVLLIIILGDMTNYSDEVKIIWYWVIGILAVAGVTYLILIKK